MPPEYVFTDFLPGSSKSKRSRSSSARFFITGWHPVQPADHDQILPSAEDFIDAGGLANEPNPLPDLIRIFNHIEAGNSGPAAIGSQQRRQNPNARGLARSVGSEQTKHTSPRNGEADSIDSLCASKGLAELDCVDRKAAIAV